MLKYYQKKGESSSSKDNYDTSNDSNGKQKFMKVDLNSLPSDPGRRPSINDYHVNQRDEIRRAYLLERPFQPINHKYPATPFGLKQKLRRFNDTWFNDRKYWLEYSIKDDAVYCLCCYLFKNELPNQGGADSFVRGGFRGWNRCKVGLDEHEHGNPHKIAVQKCQNLMNPKQSIIHVYEKLTTLEKKNYRIRIDASISCVRFLLHQGLPFRGHNEKKDSHNRGNFLELLHWLAGQCAIIRDVVLGNAPLNCQMKSPDIQKDIVRVCARATIEVIRKEIGDGFFSVLIDESRDVSCKEQMAMVVRYVNVEGDIVEWFIGIKHVNSTTALSLKAYMDTILTDCKLSHTRIRGQGYDGASNMSGEFNGLKTLIMKETKSAYFVHCFAHQLQLALVAVAKKHLKVSDFFFSVTQLLNHIGNSFKQRDKLRETHAIKVVEALVKGDIESGTGQNQEVGIKRPCDTRWGSHFASILNIQRIYSSIITVLEGIGYDDSSKEYERKAEALRICRDIRLFDFVLCLHLMVDILGVTETLNKTLQKKDQDIINAMNQVRASKERLQQMWNDGWGQLLEDVTSFCVKHDLDILDMEAEFYDGISRRRGLWVSNLHHYQYDVFNSVIDMQLQELNHRFNEVNMSLLLCMACLCPSDSFKAFDVAQLKKMATFYPDEFSTDYDLRALEVDLKNYIVDMRGDKRFIGLKGIVELSKMMVKEKKHELFPKVYLLFKLALVLPVATSSVERSFSAMKLIKTDLRNKMGDEFMHDCLLSYIEKDILDDISNDTLFMLFQGMKTRRIKNVT